MRISQLVFKDIGPFDEAIFEFPEPEGQGELVLFEGPNGSGKTTVVETIAVVAGEICGTDASRAPSLRQRYRGLSGSIEAIVSNEEHFIHISRDRNSKRKGSIPSEPLFAALRERFTQSAWAAFAFRGHQGTASLATEGPKDISLSPMQDALSFGNPPSASEHLGQLLTNLENQRTKALTYARERSDEQGRQDLERLAQSRLEAIHRFERVFSEALARPVSIEFSIDQQAPRIRFDREEIPLQFLGEGMRSTLSWLSNLLVRLERIPWQDGNRSPLDQDFWLILDEIDESLHPTMQARILPALRRLLPNARIYATTHSPFVVASLGEGTVFSIRPDQDHRVRGKVASTKLEPGQSLELVTSDIFNAPSEFVDDDTRQKLAEHERDIRAIEERNEIDWGSFISRRIELMKRNDEVRTAVAMQELPVKQAIQRHLRKEQGGTVS